MAHTPNKLRYLAVPALLLVLIGLMRSTVLDLGSPSPTSANSATPAEPRRNLLVDSGLSISASKSLRNPTNRVPHDLAGGHFREVADPLAKNRPDCRNCEEPNFYSLQDRDVGQQIIRDATQHDHPSEAEFSAPEDEAKSVFIPRIMQSHPGSGVTLLDPVDMGFPYSPKSWSAGEMEVVNASGKNLKVSLHGPGAAGAVIDGQPVVEGQQYDINGSVQIKSSQPMGVHIRSSGPSVSTLPDSNG